MRSDYALYMVAIILFIITGIGTLMLVEPERLWVITTAVLGLLFVGFGYMQRPKTQSVAVEVAPSTPAPPAPTLTPLLATEVKEEEKAETIEVAAPVIMQLTEVRGIGEKRAEQLRTLGISSVENLAKASAKDLASKLKVSPKITGKWIENAKKLLEKP